MREALSFNNTIWDIMTSYQPLNEENLLVLGQTPSGGIHSSFFDKHIMNLVELDDSIVSNPKDIVVLLDKRRNEIKASLENLRIYKYIDIKGLEFWLKSSMLFWDRVSDSWEDPYENYFLKESFVLEDGTPLTGENNIPGVFGQSWTVCEETDAMWRIYSNEDKSAGKLFTGIRIETTAQKLLNVIYVDDDSMADTWLGLVQYLSEEEINNTLVSGIKNFNTSLGESFFNKRLEFDHEREFRAIKVLDSKTIELTSDYKRLAFPVGDMNTFIDSFVLDPRLTDSNYEVLKNRLIELGVKPEKIRKSDLYHFKPVTVSVKY